MNRHLSKTHRVSKADDAAVLPVTNAHVPAAPLREPGTKPETAETRVSQVPPAKVPSSEAAGSLDNQGEDGEDDFRQSCNQCWFAAETPDQLSDHVKTKHPEPAPEEACDDVGNTPTAPLDPSTLPELITDETDATLAAIEAASTAVDGIISGAGSENNLVEVAAGLPEEQPMEESPQEAGKSVLDKDSKKELQLVRSDNQPDRKTQVKQENPLETADVQIGPESHPDVTLVEEEQPAETVQAQAVDQTPEHSSEIHQALEDLIIETGSSTEQESMPMELTSPEMTEPSSVETADPSSVETADPSSVEMTDSSPGVPDADEVLNNEADLKLAEAELQNTFCDEQVLESFSRLAALNDASRESYDSLLEETESGRMLPEVDHLPEMTETGRSEPMDSESVGDPITVDLGNIFKTELEVNDEVLMLARHAELVVSSEPGAGVKVDEFFLPVAETSQPVAVNSSKSSEKFKIQCNLCDYSTSDSSLMDNHLGWDGHFGLGQENICQRCTFAASTKEEYTEHGKVHSESFTLANWECIMCNFKTGQAETMEIHLNEKH